MQEKKDDFLIKFEFKPINILIMKTIKKTSIAVLSILAFVSCSKNDEETANDLPAGIALKADVMIKVSDLPQSILDFVANEFPDLTIRKSEQEDNGNFEVKLSNGTEIVFDANGGFLGVDDDSEENGDFDDSEIDIATILPNIMAYIEANYPDFNIKEASLENNNHYEIELSDDIVLIFDANGEFLGIGVDENDQDGDGEYEWGEGDHHDDGENIDPAELPDMAIAYLEETYPELTILHAEIEDHGDFEVTMSNRLEVYFDAEGNFISEDED